MAYKKEKKVDMRGLAVEVADVLRTRSYVVPLAGIAKVGATAGWALPTTTNVSTGATMAAGGTASTLVVPIPGLEIGDILTSVSLNGQVESAGNNVSLTMNIRKITNVAADDADASIASDSSGTLTADTVLSSANVNVTGMSEVVAEGETFYALITATTAASTDIVLESLIVTVQRT